MNDKKWHYLKADDFKCLHVSPDVLEFVKKDLSERTSAEIVEVKTSHIASIDLPGMCFIGRQMWSTMIDGLKIEIPITDVEPILVSMEQNFNLEKFEQRGYYNVYGWINCISLNRSQYEALIAEMKKDIDTIRPKAKAERDALLNGLRGANNIHIDGLNNVRAHGKTISNIEVALQQNVPFNGQWS